MNAEASQTVSTGDRHRDGAESASVPPDAAAPGTPVDSDTPDVTVELLGLDSPALDSTTLAAPPGARTRPPGRFPRARRWLRALPPVRVDDRLGRAILSILLAGLLWYYVVNLENPALTTIYTDIPVDVRGLPASLKIINTPEPVDATVQAPQSVLGTLSKSDVRPYIDLRGLSTGVHNVQVRGDVRGLQPSAASVQFSPATLQVQVEELASGSFPVEVRVTGTPALGYGAETPQSDVGNVNVRGVAEAISRVKRVVVNVDIEDKASTQQGSRSPVALDAEGRQIEGLTFEPAAVNVVVPVRLLFNYKVVPVRVPVLGQPASGYRVSAITVDPTNATVCCSPDVLEPLQFLDTSPVVITGTISSVLTSTQLILPPQVELYPGQTRTITVTVQVEALVTTLQVSVSPIVEGKPEGASTIISPDRLDLTLAGTFDQLQGLKPTDVQAFINVQGREPGTYTLRPQVIVPQGVKLESAVPESVTVTIIAPTPVPTATALPTATASPTATPAPATPVGDTAPTSIPLLPGTNFPTPQLSPEPTP